MDKINQELYSMTKELTDKIWESCQESADVLCNFSNELMNKSIKNNSEIQEMLQNGEIDKVKTNF